MNTALPLNGKNIVVTRPADQAAHLCRLIGQYGGTAIRFPVLAIDAPPDAAALASLIDRLHHFDMAFFVSPNAVRYGISAVRARRPWPPTLRVAAVGTGSRQALREQGFNDIIVPDSGFDSEAALALAVFSANAVRGKNIVIFRGDGGRDLFGATLRERGASVEYLSCYRRYLPHADPQPLLEQASRHKVHASILTSSEGVKNYVELIGPAGMRSLAQVPVFAPHSRIVEHARVAGFTQVIQTASGDSGMINGLLSWHWV